MKYPDTLPRNNRAIVLGNYTIHPYIDLKPSAAWALSFEASQRRMTVGQLVAAIVESWADAWEEQLGETDRRLFLSSIPRGKRSK